MEYPFGQFGSAVPAMTSSNLLPTSILLAFGRVGVGERALVLCEHCSATAKTLVSYQRLPDTKHSTMRAATGNVNSIPARPNIDGSTNNFFSQIMINSYGDITEGSKHDEHSIVILMINWNVTLCMPKRDFIHLKITVQRTDNYLLFSLCDRDVSLL